MAVDLFLVFYRSQYYFKIVELSLFKSYEHVNCDIHNSKFNSRTHTRVSHDSALESYLACKRELRSPSRWTNVWRQLDIYEHARRNWLRANKQIALREHSPSSLHRAWCFFTGHFIFPIYAAGPLHVQGPSLFIRFSRPLLLIAMTEWSFRGIARGLWRDPRDNDTLIVSRT